MPDYNPRRFKRGDEWTADAVNRINDELKAMRRVTVGSGLEARWGAGGLQLAAVPGIALRLGTASAAIGPRSGSTCGIGTLDLVAVDPATGAVASTGETLSVVNPSSSTFSAGVSIKSGHYCVAVLIAGAWVAFPLEC